MADNAAINQLLQIGAEVTPGSQVAATKRMQSLMVSPKSGQQTMIGTPQGSKLRAALAITEVWSEWAATLNTPTYGEMCYLYASALGIVTPGALGSAGGKSWAFASNPFGADTHQTYTLEHGSAADARTALNAFVSQLALKLTRKAITGTATLTATAIVEGATLTALAQVAAVWTLTTTGIPAGGTFTLTISGTGFATFTTGTIVFNATATAVAAAINTAAPSPFVTATGGPLPTGVVITFGGVQGDVTVTKTDSLTGGTSPATVLVHTTPGVNIYPEYPMLPLQPQLTDLYIDQSAAGLGTTVMARAFELDVTWGSLASTFFPMRSTTTSFAGLAETENNSPIVLTLQADTAGRAYLASNFTPGTTMFVRAKTGGPTIDGSNSFLHQLDVCVGIDSGFDYQVTDNLYTIRYSGHMYTDPAWGKGSAVLVQNKLAAL